jgi:tripartite-type tricarboxylate transporter receptor subunit TctC
VVQARKAFKTLSIGTIGAAVSFAASVATAQAASVADFYKNKTMTVLVGSSVGGGYDQYGRLLGRHMGRHIPGRPNFIPKNMPGAGGLRALNFVANVAPRDGTILATLVRSTFFDPLMYPHKAVKVDSSKLTWYGSINKEFPTCVTWRASNFANLDDLGKRVSIMGSTGPAATGTIIPKILNEIAGTKMRIIMGYPGSTQIHLAMERGEVTGRCGLGWDSIIARYGDWLKEKKINMFVQWGLTKHPELPDVPLFLDLGRDEKEKQMLYLLSAPNEMGRPFFGTPGVPEDRVKALQVAFMETMKDPKFLAEARKLSVAVDPISGPAAAELVTGLWNTPKDVLAKAQTILASKKGLERRKVSYRTVSATLTKTNKKRSRIYFMDNTKEVSASIGGRQTKVTVGGKKAPRKELKKGMSCDITYEGDKSLAKTVACK